MRSGSKHIYIYMIYVIIYIITYEYLNVLIYVFFFSQGDAPKMLVDDECGDYTIYIYTLSYTMYIYIIYMVTLYIYIHR